jgi:hypothetical protein
LATYLNHAQISAVDKQIGLIMAIENLKKGMLGEVPLERAVQAYLYWAERAIIIYEHSSLQR